MKDKNKYFTAEHKLTNLDIKKSNDYTELTLDTTAAF